MSETVPLTTWTSSLKRVKNKTAASRTPNKPDGTLSEKILKVVGSSKERNGVSVVALKKSLVADGCDLQRNGFRINAAVRKLIASEQLVQTKGTGTAGSFKLNKEKSAKVKKSDSTRKVVKTTIKAKAAKKATKMPAVKRAVRKISPKKARRPAGASLKQSSNKSAKVKKNVNKVLPRTKGKTKETKAKSKPVAKGLKNKKVTLKKK